MPQEESRERFDEAVEIMQRAWTEERFSYDGRFFKVPEVSRHSEADAASASRRSTRCA